jgi:hypothetical protein
MNDEKAKGAERNDSPQKGMFRTPFIMCLRYNMQRR